MGASITYPDGSILTSSALTIAQINAILQPLTMGMLGIPADSSSPLVRINWPTEGAPFTDGPEEDICFLACVTKDDPYDKIRDKVNSFAASPNLEETWNYTRVWSVSWCCYGPNSTDRMRAIRSALYQDYFTNALSTSEIFPMSNFSEPVRAPELIDGQWFERVDFSAEMYEYVTETILRTTVVSVETIIENSDGIIADVTTA